jgi:4-hydroxybenzoate polyprenyltransferase
MVAFKHTIFALPFALMGMMLAAGGLPRFSTIALICLAMVGARTAAMAFNRIVDQRLDRMNPRTAGRPLASGRLSRGWAAGVLGAAIALFVLSAGSLNRLCLYLSPLALVIILSYSLTKRFTPLTHFHLGASLGLAPVAAWIGVTGEIDLPPLILGLAVTLWTAGFDIIYACQDLEFDRQAGLHSLPVRVGVPGALRLSAVLHALMVIALATLPLTTPLNLAYTIGVVAVAVILVIEHRLVRPDDLSRVNAAFFTANGWISVGLFVATLIDLVML